MKPNIAPEPMRAAVARFFTEYDAAFDQDLSLSNKAYNAHESAYCYLAGFTLENKGLTPEEANKLLQLMDVYQSAKDDADIAQVLKADAIKRLDLAFRKPFA